MNHGSIIRKNLYTLERVIIFQILNSSVIARNKLVHLILSVGRQLKMQISCEVQGKERSLHGDLLGRGGLVREDGGRVLSGWAQEQPGDGGGVEWGEGASQRAEKTFSN